MGWIGDVRVAVGERQLLALDQRVYQRRRGLRVIGNAEAVLQAQHLQQSDALAVGWQLVDLHAAIVDAQRLDPSRALGAEVISQ